MTQKYIITFAYIAAATAISLTSCSNRKPEADATSIETTSTETQQPSDTPKTIKPFGDPEKDWIFVQQAVDAWLYFNLSDYKSYQPLIRSNDYDSIRDVYTHHLRFRYVNEQGGPVTLNRDFEVDLNRPGLNGNPFHVLPLQPLPAGPPYSILYTPYSKKSPPPSQYKAR